MKRLHAHVSVDVLGVNVRIYSTVLGTVPTVLKPDYAKLICAAAIAALDLALAGEARTAGANLS